MADSNVLLDPYGPLDGDLQRLLDFASAEVGAAVTFVPLPARNGSQRRSAHGEESSVPVAGRLHPHGVLRVALSGPIEVHLARFLVAIARLLGERLDQAYELAAHVRGRVERVDRILAHDGVGVVYQPIFDLRRGNVVGVEALARFADPALEPQEWFVEADAVGRGLDLEVRAVAHAVAALRTLPTDVYVSVNVSPTVAMATELHRLLRPLDLERLVFEITEHAQVTDYEELNEALQPLRSRGLRLAVDDAGAGFASLRHILRIHPDIIKLDMSLIRAIDRDSVLRALSYSIASFGAAVEAQVIAEGIETEGEYRALRFLGIAYGQGFLLQEPVGLSALARVTGRISQTMPA